MKNGSVLSNSSLSKRFAEYNNGCTEKYMDIFAETVNAFERETSVLLDVNADRSCKLNAKRYEPLRLYIIKLLLFVGVTPDGNTLAVLARLIEVLSIYPDTELDTVICDFARSHYSSVRTVERMIDKGFCIYDQQFYERITHLTESAPMTSKDVLCDLALFVRLKYINEADHERYIEQ